LKDAPFRLAITGHTAASRIPPRAGYSAWELSSDRANAVRRTLQEDGVPADRIASVTGKAETQPLFPDDPYIAANRRVTITILREAPPIPPDHNP
jgi:chemotaxis protein MotB